jgi:hypothetical protein
MRVQSGTNIKNGESWGKAYEKLDSRLWGDYPLTCLASSGSCHSTHAAAVNLRPLSTTAAHQRRSGWVLLPANGKASTTSIPANRRQYLEHAA